MKIKLKSTEPIGMQTAVKLNSVFEHIYSKKFEWSVVRGSIIFTSISEGGQD